MWLEEITEEHLGKELDMYIGNKFIVKGLVTRVLKGDVFDFKRYESRDNLSKGRTFCHDANRRSHNTGPDAYKFKLSKPQIREVW